MRLQIPHGVTYAVLAMSSGPFRDASQVVGLLGKEQKSCT